MAYMAQQWLTNAVRDAFRRRSDAATQIAEVARVRAWLASLPLDPGVIATLDEPIAALEAGLTQAAREDKAGPSGSIRPGERRSER
jgi:hypothetical protein